MKRRCREGVAVGGGGGKGKDEVGGVDERKEGYV